MGLTSLLFFEGAAALVWAALTAIALADRRTMRPVLPREPSRPLAPVTIIVPARNESRNIGAWLHDARRQTHKPERIIVADDCSDDETARAARCAAEDDERVEVRDFGPPPAGWVGKTWAAYNAALLARSDWLLFSDADMRMHPDTLASAMAAARASGAEAFSMTATLECGTFWERQVMPAIAALIFSAMPVCLVNDDRCPLALMMGGFMLVRRETYLRVGGHRAVRSSIAEDRDLAERFKAFGYRIRLYDGSALARVRMYRGLAQMWAGWRKNFFEGARRNPWLAGVCVLTSVATLVLPLPTLLALGMRTLRSSEGGHRVPLSPAQQRLAFYCGVSVASNALVRLVRDPAIGRRAGAMSVAAAPIAGAFIAAVMAASAWRIMSGQGQRWKGRTIR